MSAFPFMDVTGEKQVRKALRQLAGKPARRAVRKAVTAGGTPIVKQAKANLSGHKRSGALRRSIGKKRPITYANGNIVGVIGPKLGMHTTYQGKFIDPAFYAHLAEFGTKAHTVGKSVVYLIGRQWVRGPIEHPGAKGIRFMSRALASTKTAVFAAFKKKALIEIEKEANKVRAKR